MGSLERKMARRLEAQMEPIIRLVRKGFDVDDSMLDRLGDKRGDIEIALRRLEYRYDPDRDAWRLAVAGEFVEWESIN